MISKKYNVISCLSFKFSNVPKLTFPFQQATSIRPELHFVLGEQTLLISHKNNHV